MHQDGSADLLGPKSSKGDYIERIARLSEKLTAANEVGTHQDEKGLRSELLQAKLTTLDERVSTCQDLSHKKFMALKEQLLKFQKDLDSERTLREASEQAKTEEVVSLDASLQANLRAEQEALRETETRVLSIFETKTNTLKEEMIRSGKLRMENEANLRRYLEVDIPKLYESLKEEVSNREAMEQRMLQKAMDEVTELQSAVLEEKKAREDTEEAMLRMMEDVVTKMQAEIANERRERERTEEMLLTLLNETCQKLQMASNGI
eukprot:TRINITY_DN14170_c2_g3_i1.p1 TRINITY_DN14170_c2_g3~~TRINITY_DN14170_c2_g3_i1.p1  ORF type:complete len:264 (+),score=80.06 TRINITY_DN14170_c2_g3_i1:109-900(+)